MKLTDEQVALLLAECDPETWSHSLALEVQQSRQRRCDGCAHWSALAEDATEGECPRMGCQTSRGWFCADFTPWSLADTLS